MKVILSWGVNLQKLDILIMIIGLDLPLHNKYRPSSIDLFFLRSYYTLILKNNF